MFFRQSLLVLGILLVAISGAQAQLVRTFVSTTGSDSNPCTPDAPCRTLPVAINATASGGTVIALNSGGYGSDITFSKSISIVAPAGIVAQIRQATTSGIIVNGSNISVSIEGFSITGTNTLVVFQSGRSLKLNRMVMQGGSTAIYHGAAGTLTMHDSRMQDADHCFYASGSSNTLIANATITNTHADNCKYGFGSWGASRVTIKDSSATGRSNTMSECYAGFIAQGNSLGSGYLDLNGVTVSNCYYGVASGPFNSGGSAEISMADLIITDNNTATAVNTGNLGRSFGGNQLSHNTVNTMTFSSTPMQ